MVGPLKLLWDVMADQSPHSSEHFYQQFVATLPLRKKKQFASFRQESGELMTMLLSMAACSKLERVSSWLERSSGKSSFMRQTCACDFINTTCQPNNNGAHTWQCVSANGRRQIGYTCTHCTVHYKTKSTCCPSCSGTQ